MSANWKFLARKAGFRFSEDNSIDVAVGTSRQVIHVDDREPDALRLWSVVSSEKTLSEVADDGYLRYAWEKNRFADLVSFTVDHRQRLVGETWVATPGLSPDEFSLHVREVARICDWHEFRLTGSNVY